MEGPVCTTSPCPGPTLVMGVTGNLAGQLPFSCCAKEQWPGGSNRTGARGPLSVTLLTWAKLCAEPQVTAQS